MATRSLNRVQIIGNLTRDPELRYTPQGVAVCTFGVATNREWTLESGEKKEEAEFHRVVSWNKLAEICNQFLSKGRKVFIEGRLQTRQWEAQDGARRQQTEIVASDMIILDSRGREGSGGEKVVQVDGSVMKPQAEKVEKKEGSQSAGTIQDNKTPPVKKEPTSDKGEEVKEVNSDDIPF